jgi:hypothetical protein
VLAGEGEATVGPPEEVPLLVVDEGGVFLALPSAPHLVVVEEPCFCLPMLRLGAFPEPSHARMVYDAR